MPGIFVSYRRADSIADAGRLADLLQHHFSDDEVFFDAESIPIGSDFVRTLEKTLDSCDVLIAVIGPEWLAHLNSRQRLDEPDYMRIEIAAALRRGIDVIPVLVADATMPPPSSLPEELRPLARRQALRLHYQGFRRHVDTLVQAIIASRGATQHPPASRVRSRGARREQAESAEQISDLGRLRRQLLRRPRDVGLRKRYLATRTIELQDADRARANIIQGAFAAAGACLAGAIVGPVAGGAFYLFQRNDNLMKTIEAVGVGPALAIASFVGALLCLGGVPFAWKELKDERRMMSVLGPVSWWSYLAFAKDAARLNGITIRDAAVAASEGGDVEAQNLLGEIYEDGKAVVRDEAEAVRWYRAAAEQGFAAAQYSLGRMYNYGRGVAKDEAEAVRWYRAAAEQGLAVAQNDLGSMYFNGTGVKKDDGEALRWFQEASRQGYELAKKNLRIVSKRRGRP